MNPTHFSELQQVISTHYETPLEQALAYAAAGLKVFPISATSKRPACAHGFKDATTDSVQIEKWFGRGKKLVGLPATINGLIIIDLDVDEDKDAVAGFEALEDAHAPVDTFTVHTPRGGYHLYFQHPAPQAKRGERGYIKQRTSVGIPGLDVRTQGYVLAPSTPQAAKQYTVEPGTAPIAALPEWIREHVTHKESLRPVFTGEARGEMNEGSRNNHLSDIAYAMIKEGYTEDDVLHDLLLINREDFAEPLEDGEVLGIVERKFRADIEPGVLLDVATQRLAALAVEPTVAPYEKKFDPLRMPTYNTDAKLHAMLQEFVYIENGRQVGSVLRRSNKVVKLSEWELMHPGSYTYEKDGEAKSMKLVEGWKMFSKKCAAEVYAPGALAIVTRHGLDYFNTYQLPIHPAVEGMPTTTYEHIDFLLPEAREREYFLDWLAYKAQNPSRRAPAVMMVAKDVYGLGRSILGDAISNAFGSGVRALDFGTFSGNTGQAAFDDWQDGLLIGIVDEAVSVATSGTQYSRKNAAYESIKDRVDTRNRTVKVSGKYKPQREITLYSSYLIFTNHSDAIQIPEDDRRLNVFTNPSQRQPQSYYNRVAPILSECPLEAARLWQYLRARDVSNFNASEAMITDAKTSMYEQSLTPLQQVTQSVIETAPGAAMTKAQWVNWCLEAWANEHGEGAVPSWVTGALVAEWSAMPWIGGTRQRSIIDSPSTIKGNRVQVGVKQICVVCIKPAGNTRFDFREWVRIEVAKNDSGTLRAVGKIGPRSPFDDSPTQD